MAYNKPIPVPQGESDVYWQKAYFYPTDFCRNLECTTPRGTKWVKASGKATLFTYGIVQRAPHPGFADDVPFVTAIVELEEGPKMATNVLIENPTFENLKIGMPLEVVFEDITDELALPKFKPAQITQIMWN